MLKNRYLILVWTLFCIPTVQADISAPVVQRDGISEYRLENGLRVILAPDAASPAIAFNMLYLSGSLADPPGKSGTAHLLEHLLAKGADKQLIEGLNRRGIRFNATTSYDRTRYAALLAAEQGTLDYLIAQEAERMRNTRFGQAELDAEREVVLRELEQTQDVPLTALTQGMLAAAMPGTGFGRPVLGSREELRRIDVEDLRAFYARHYQPGNALIVITGRFEADKALQAIERHFAGLPGQAIAAPRVATSPGKAAVARTEGGNTEWIALAYPLAAASAPANAMLAPLADILASEPHGRLYRELVVADKTAGVVAQTLNFRQGGYFLVAAPLAKGQSMAAAQAALVAQLEGLVRQPIDEAELQRFKSSVQPAKARVLKDHATLADLLAEHAALGDWQLFLNHYERIARLTAAEVQQQAQSHFHSDRRIVGELRVASAQSAPREKRDPAPAASPARSSSATAAPTSRVGDGAEPVDLAAFNRQVMAVESTIRRTSLDNGLKLVLRPLPDSGKPVQGVLNLRFGDETGLFGKRALADLVGALLARGTQSHSYQQIVDQVTRMGATVLIKPEGELLTVHFSAGRDDLPTLLELIADILRHPAFPATEFDLAKRLRRTALSQPADQPAAVAALYLNRHAAPYPVGDVRRHAESAEMLAALRPLGRDDVLAFHRDFYGADRGEFVLSGNFDPQQVERQVRRLFGDWNSKARYARPARPYRNVSAARLHVHAEAPRTGYYLARLHFDAGSQSQEQAALFIAERILGRHPLVSRLGQRLREGEKLSYDVRTSIRVDPLDHAGWVAIQADYPLGQGRRLADLVKDEVARLIEHGITEQELEQARQAILHERRLNFGQERGVLSLLQRLLHEGATLQPWAERNEDFARIRLEQVNAAIRKHFRLDTFVEVLADADGETQQRL